MQSKTLQLVGISYDDKMFRELPVSMIIGSVLPSVCTVMNDLLSSTKYGITSLPLEFVILPSNWYLFNLFWKARVILSWAPY